MAISKLIFNGVTQMDVTQDTVAAANLLSGETATGADGEHVVGVYVPASPTLQTKSVSYTPTETAQSATVTADQGYDGLDEVNVSVGAIPSQYIVPTGTYTITAPGTYNIKSYENVEVEIDMWTEQTISTSGAVTQALDPYVLYHFTGSLTSLSVTLGQASGIACYHFDFDCGSTAPTVTIPNTVTMPDSQTFDADNHYEVDILNNYGAVLSWEIS